MLTLLLRISIVLSLLLFAAAGVMRASGGKPSRNSDVPEGLKRVAVYLNYLGGMLICLYIIATSARWTGRPDVLSVCAAILCAIFLMCPFFEGSFVTGKVFWDFRLVRRLDFRVGFTLVLVGSVVFCATCMFIPRLVTNWRIHSILENRRVNVSNKQYFDVLAETFPDFTLVTIYPDLEHVFSFRSTSDQNVNIAARREPNSKYSISLRGDLKFSDKDKVPDLGDMASRESTWLMTRIVSHIGPRLSSVDIIDYDVSDHVSDSAAEYKAILIPDELVAYEAKHPEDDTSQAVEATRKVLVDSANGKAWPKASE
jgi:hypothetical protein